MCLTSYLAFVIGSYLVLVNLAYLLNRSFYKKFISDFTSQEVLVYMSGIIAVIFGLMIVACHNVWVNDWPVSITIFGWAALIQGIVRLFCPEKFCKFAKQLYVKKSYWIVSLIWMFVGVYLFYEGCQSASSLIVR